MSLTCEQFYRTWCYAGRSVNGADGWRIRAKSAGLSLPEAEGMADLANYWVPASSSSARVPGTRLALFRPSAGQAVLVHGVLRPGLVGGRAGVSFEHLLARLPGSLSVLDAIRLWGSPAWRREDGEFSAALEPFPWEAALADSADSGAGPATPGDLAAFAVRENANLPWAAVLQACLELPQRSIEKLFLAGPADELAKLLLVAFNCLPGRFCQELTFSTHENPRGTKGVRIVGVTVLEAGETDLPAFCYEGQYRAVNLFEGLRSDSLIIGPAAALMIDWLRCGQSAHVQALRERFGTLDPADAPGTRELDLLSLEVARGPGDATADQRVELLSNRAISRSRIRDPGEIARLLAAAEAEGTLLTRLAAEWSGWLPADESTAHALVAALATAAWERLQAGAPFESLAAVAGFAGLTSTALEARVWAALYERCRNAPPETPAPTATTRLRLLSLWLAEGGETAAAQSPSIPAGWLQVIGGELASFLQSPLPFALRRECLEHSLSAPGGWDGSAAVDFVNAVAQAPELALELLHRFPNWAGTTGSAAASLDADALAGLTAAIERGLPLAAALGDRTLAWAPALAAWQALSPVANTPYLDQLGQLAVYLQHPSPEPELPPELLSREFWTMGGEEEHAVVAAIDRLLEAAVPADFEGAIHLFGHGAWTPSPLGLVSLAGRRVADPTPTPRPCQPGVREIIETLGQILREWEDKARPAFAPEDRANAALPVLPAPALTTLARLLLDHFPERAFLKSPTGRECLRVLKKEQHLIDPERSRRLEELGALTEACSARAPSTAQIATLALRSVDGDLDAGLRTDLDRAFQAALVRSPKSLVGLCRELFDRQPGLFCDQLLPPLFDFLVFREATVHETVLTDCLAAGLADLGPALALQDPGLGEKIRLFTQRLPTGSRHRFERAMGRGATGGSTARPGYVDRGSGLAPANTLGRRLRRATGRVYRVLACDTALRLYFLILSLAAGLLAFHFRHPILKFFRQVFDLK